MKFFAPDYYDRFACIKGSCRHSCCIGWEIDIDEDSLAYFQSIGGETGKRLEENIVLSDEGAHFKLGEHERCPFLNREGLCGLIIELGEDSLCQICADHPRFRNFWSDREETGLGICCEAAAVLILGCKEAVNIIETDDDGEEDYLSEDEAEVLGLRDELIAIVQDRSLGIDARIKKLQMFAEIDLFGVDYSHWRKVLLGLERLDDHWADELERLDGDDDAAVSPALQLPFEQLMVYLIYRHVNADDDDLSGRIAYCILIWKLLRAMLRDGGFKDLCELARLYSSEIEYSDENTAAIIDELHRLYSQI